MSNGLDLRSHGQTAYPGNPQGAASDSLGALAITGIDEEIWYCDNSRGNQWFRPYRP